jgi:uncharacterized membrane protein YjjP (DUF1212 family)
VFLNQKKNLDKLKDGKSKNDTLDGSSPALDVDVVVVVAAVVVVVVVALVVVVGAAMDGGTTFFGDVIVVAFSAPAAAFGLNPFLPAATAGFTGGFADNFKAIVAVSNFPEVSGLNV